MNSFVAIYHICICNVKRPDYWCSCFSYWCWKKYVL